MNFIDKMVEKFIEIHRRMRRWRRVLFVLSAITVFAVTYALILPAITMDRDTAEEQPGIEAAAANLPGVSGDGNDGGGSAGSNEPEVNPEDIVEKGKGYVESLLSLGVNRLSIGVQSFDDRMLQWMNRRHDAAGAKEAFRLAREAGAENISLDLIFGITHLDDAVWADTIDQAIALGPEHISCYQLSVEGESALAEMVAEGRYTEADDALCRRQYDMLCQKLGAAGYHHYEISNFAKEGFEAVHNGGYWARRPYVGIGPGAHSFRGNARSWNSKALRGWTSTKEILSPEDSLVETLMLSLRTDKGVDADFLHGNCSKEDIGRLLEAGALVRTGDRYRIPEDHFFVSDEIIRELI